MFNSLYRRGVALPLFALVVGTVTVLMAATFTIWSPYVQKVFASSASSKELYRQVNGHSSFNPVYATERCELISIEEHLPEIGLVRCIVAVRMDSTDANWTPVVAYTKMPCAYDFGQVVSLVEVKDALDPRSGEDQKMVFIRDRFAFELE